MMNRPASLFILLISLALAQSYDVQRAPLEQSWLARMIGKLFTNIPALPCPHSPIQVSQDDFNMLNSLLASAYLNKNIHFRASKRMFFNEDDNYDMPTNYRIARRSNVANEALEIAKILPNNQICFAGVRLDHKLPRERGNAQNFVDIINAFSQYMSHNQAMRSGSYRRLSLDDL